MPQPRKRTCALRCAANILRLTRRGDSNTGPGSERNEDKRQVQQYLSIRDSLAARFINIIKDLGRVRDRDRCDVRQRLLLHVSKKRFSCAIFSCQKGKFLNNIFCHCPKFGALHQIRADVFCATSSKFARNKMAPRPAPEVLRSGEGLCFLGYAATGHYLIKPGGRFRRGDVEA